VRLAIKLEKITAKKTIQLADFLHALALEFKSIDIEGG